MLKIILLLAISLPALSSESKEYEFDPVELCEYQSRTKDFDVINQEQFIFCLEKYNYSKKEIETIIHE